MSFEELEMMQLKQENEKLRELLVEACKRLQHYFGDSITQEFLNKLEIRQILNKGGE